MKTAIHGKTHLEMNVVLLYMVETITSPSSAGGKMDGKRRKTDISATGTIAYPWYASTMNARDETRENA